MKRLSRFLFLGLLLPVWLPAQQTIAIGDFINQTDRLYLDSWGKKIPAFLASELSSSGEFTLVERQDLQSLLDERAISMSGLTDDSTAQSIGQIMSAEYMISGSMSQLNGITRVDARIMNTRTGKTVSEKVQGPLESMDKMIELLANNITFQLTGKGNPRERMKLKPYPAAYTCYTSIGLGLSAWYAHSRYQDRYDAYHQTTRLNEFNTAYDSANRWHKARNALIISSGVCAVTTLVFWIKNINTPDIVASVPVVQPYVCAQKGEALIGLHMDL